MLYHRKYHFYQASARIPQLQRRCGWQIFTAHKGDHEMKYGFLQSDTFQMQENGLERGLGNGHLGLDNSRTHIMRPTSERDIGLHETDFWAYSAGENIQTTIIARIQAYGVKHTQVKSTLSPNEAGNNVSISGWIRSTNIHMVIHSFSVNDVKKITTRKICTKKVTMKHCILWWNQVRLLPKCDIYISHTSQTGTNPLKILWLV